MASTEARLQSQDASQSELPKQTVSVVIPVYLAADTLRTLYDQLSEVLPRHTEAYEIIFVEDCGGDSSWDVITDIVEMDNRVKGIKLYRNFGQHNAILCGLREAKYDITVTLDDDLQNPPTEIPKLLGALTRDVDVVYGKPQKVQHNFLRNLASYATKLILQSVLGAKTARDVSAFRAFRTDLRNAFEYFRSPTVSIDVLLTWGTNKFSAVDVRHQQRESGTSGYTIGKLITHAFVLMTGFTAVPLRIASIAGFIFMLFGFGVLFWVIWQFLFGAEDSVPGFTFLASAIAIFSGVQLFALGILGEYLARVHFRTMNQPPYLVAQTVTQTPAGHKTGSSHRARSLQRHHVQGQNGERLIQAPTDLISQACSSQTWRERSFSDCCQPSE